jgi:hypothetical protein
VQFCTVRTAAVNTEPGSCWRKQRNPPVVGGELSRRTGGPGLVHIPNRAAGAPKSLPQRPPTALFEPIAVGRMKPCPYCGRENDDSSERCLECLTSLVPESGEQWIGGEPAKRANRPQSTGSPSLGISWCRSGLTSRSNQIVDISEWLWMMEEWPGRCEWTWRGRGITS